LKHLYYSCSEQKVEGFVKARSRNWLIAFAVAFVLFIVLVVVIFRKQPATDQSYKKEIQQLDSTIKYQQKTIDALNVYNESQDSLISNLNEKLKSNKTTETRIIHSYEKIPSDVRSYSKDSLRRAITEYQ
jgi:septal ring factor EnvC (AmiA/AmiB activator)